MLHNEMNFKKHKENYPKEITELISFYNPKAKKKKKDLCWRNQSDAKFRFWGWQPHLLYESCLYEHAMWIKPYFFLVTTVTITKVISKMAMSIKLKSHITFCYNKSQVKPWVHPSNLY